MGEGPKCPGCGCGPATDADICDSGLEINLARIKCLRAKTTKGPIRLSNSLLTYMFKDEQSSDIRPGSKWTQPPIGIEEPDPQEGPVAMPGPIPEEEMENESLLGLHSLTVVSYNSDGQLKHRAAELLCYLRNINADVVLLQDTEKLSWSHNALLTQGWSLHRHKKCAILLKWAWRRKLFARPKLGT